MVGWVRSRWLRIEIVRLGSLSRSSSLVVVVVAVVIVVGVVSVVADVDC